MNTPTPPPTPAAPPPARRIALAVLGRVLPGPKSGLGQDVQAALDTGLADSTLDPRDRGLATELVYGYLRLCGRIDFILSGFLKNPEAVPLPVRRILGLATYEILYCAKVPVYASVDWAVSAVRRASGKGLSGMANAVLRRVASDPQAFDDPGFYRRDRPTEAVYLSRGFSCPEWIVELWLRAYGPEATRAYLAAQAEPAPLGLRINRARPGARALFDALSRLPGVLWADYPTLAVPTGTDFAAVGVSLPEALAAGDLSRQSAAAQRILYQLGLSDWPEPIFDACAGRGGKALLLTEAGKRVYAADMHAVRLAGLPREVARLGLAPVAAFRASATKMPLAAPPGTILLDAPCSGLGVLSRRPDSKWRRNPEDIAGLTRLQGAMLESAYAALAPGGRIVYVTCTVNPSENEKAVDRLGSRHRDLVLEAEIAAEPETVLGETFYGVVLRKPV
ncbi:Ribosomal RNA small subunit methyltransferase B [Desulfovibrio sp. DV]|uniref:transcription antitermination factor NusB n=1 Tax=Desulfovibrio sp. DV TaxID=1844708 RepID=UPI00094BA033|nr:transcription antitermination factor NusB [Desulfovibrio sp. DV]OLN26097.1 Ribosomal RNA small subunit methyltransferase B [Desulfovibrio sp. DV]